MYAIQMKYNTHARIVAKNYRKICGSTKSTTSFAKHLKKTMIEFAIGLFVGVFFGIAIVALIISNDP